MKRFFCALFLVLGLASRGSAQPGPPVPTAATIPVFTVATLPAASSMTGRTVMVWDGATGGTCTAGGGGYRNLCQSNGASWITLSGGGSVPEGRTLTATAPLTGGGDLTANRAFACPTCEITTRKGAANGYAGLDVGGVVLSSQGGTGNAFTKFTGPTTTEKTFTLPDASGTLGYFSGTPGTGFVTKSDATGLVTASATSTGYANERRSSGYGNADDLITALAGSGRAVIDSTLTCTTKPCTIPAGVTLVKVGSGLLDCENAANAFVVNGLVDASDSSQLFVNCGHASGSVSGLALATPAWFGADSADADSPDDSVPTRSAILALRDSGGTLRVPANAVYNLSTIPLTIDKDDFVLQCEAGGTFKHGGSMQSNHLFVNDLTNGNSNWTIEGCIFDGNKANVTAPATSSQLLRLANLHGLTVRNDLFRNSYDVALAIRANGVGKVTDGVLVEGNRFEGIGAAGMGTTPTQAMDLSPNDGTIVSAIVANNHVIDSADARTVGFLIEDNSGTADGIEAVTVTGNECRNIGASCVRVMGTKGAQITGNHAQTLAHVNGNTSYSCWNLENAPYTNLTGNTCRDAYSGVIIQKDSDFVHITGDTYQITSDGTNPGGWGSLLYSDATTGPDHVVIENSTFVLSAHALDTFAQGNSSGSTVMNDDIFRNNDVYVQGTLDSTSNAPLILTSLCTDCWLDRNRIHNLTGGALNAARISALTTRASFTDNWAGPNGVWIFGTGVLKQKYNNVVEDSSSRPVGQILPASGTGISIVSPGSVYTGSPYIVTFTRAALAAAAPTAHVTIGTLPAKTRLTKIVCDTTEVYAGGAVTAVSLDIGKTAGGGGAEYIASHDVLTATVRKGLVNTDLGTALVTTATANGGDLPSWTGNTAIVAQIACTTANCSQLTTGSTTCYLTTETYW